MTCVWNPLNEGEDHINVYSKSIVPLGRALSNFAHFPFKHPIYGKFESVEGFYYWLLTGKEHKELKKVWGLEAKRLGQSLEVKTKIDKQFKEQIAYAIGLKIMQHKYIMDLLMHSTLPFAHYYYFGEIDKDPVIRDQYKNHKYMIDAIDYVRVELKKQYNVKHKRK
jgi:hypothetical protein